MCANLRHELSMETAKSHGPFHKRSQNRHFRGRPVQGDLARNQHIYTAKASFSAYVLVKKLLGKVCTSRPKKSTTNFGLPFCFFPFPCFASKWLKYAVFALQKAKNVGRKRGLRHLYILALRHVLGPPFSQKFHF